MTTTIHLGPGTVEDEKIFRFINALTRPPWWNKTEDWFMKSYNKPGDDEKEGFASSSKAMIVRKGAALLGKGVYAAFKPVRAGLDVGLNRARDDYDPKQDPKATKFNFEQEIQKLKAWEPSRESLAVVQADDLSEMAQLLQRTFVFGTQYFNRMWTFQEAIANRGVLIQRSGVQIDLKGLIKTVHFLNRTQTMDQLFVDKMTTLWLINAAFQLGIKLPLRQLLFDCRDRDCYDGRDKVYALLGLVYGRHDPRLLPNNNPSVGQVYANATKYIASTEQRLDIICTHGMEERLDQLPSWAPNFLYFGVSNGTTPLVDARGRIKIFNVSLSEPYVDSGPMNQQIQTLYTIGLCIGTIPRMSQLPWPGEKLDQIEKKWNETLATYRTFEPETQKMLSDISTLLGFLAGLDDVSNSHDRRNFWAGMETEIAELARNTYHELHIKYLLTLMSGQTSPGTRCNVGDVLASLRRACTQGREILCEAMKSGTQGRRFVVLDGGYIGSVP